jgi:hypothetical protein
MKMQSLVAIVAVASFVIVQAATPGIGVVKAKGSFKVDNVDVWGNGTLFSGNSVETLAVPSQLQLNSGPRLVLLSHSLSRVYDDYLLLERGGSELKEGAAYAIEARTLRVRPAGMDSTVYVGLNGANKVQVEALKGQAEVTNAEGVLVAKLMPGTALEFDPQAAGAAGPSQLTGCVKKKDSAFVLKDITTNVVVELQGTDLEAQVGNVVEVTGVMIPGATPAAGATQVIRVSELNATGKKCEVSAAPAVAAGAGAAAGAAAGAGLSTAAVVAVVGGVAAAATVGYAVAVSGDEETKSPASP